MDLKDSVMGLFLGEIGEPFFEISGYMWNDLMKMAENMLTQNPTTGTYADTWLNIKGIYTTLNVIAVSLLCLFFLYGFCRESTDLHTEMTFDRTIKLFIRLIVTSNVMSCALSWMPQFMQWALTLTSAILGQKKFGFYFDGVKIFQQVYNADWGPGTVFLTSFLFFLFTCVCGFLVIFTVMNRIIKIYMIAPFCGLALSTLAAGGQTSQVGYSYIRTFFGYVLSVLLIAVAIVISTTFIDTIVIDSNNAIVKLLEYCLKMGAVTFAIKGSDATMQKAFNL